MFRFLNSRPGWAFGAAAVIAAALGASVLLGASRAAAEGAAAGDPAPGAPSDGDVVAVVNGKPLTVKDFKDFLFERYRRAMEVFVNETLVRQEAARLGVVATPAMEAAWVREKIELVKRSPDYEYDAKQLADLEASYREQSGIGCLLEALVRSQRSTDALVKELYEARFGERRKARHILYVVRPPEGASSADLAAVDAEVKSRAEAAVTNLKKGAEFAAIARKESQDPGSAARGGELPPVARKDVAPELGDLLFRLKPGELGGPVRTGFGWHILEVLEVTPAERPLDDALAKELAQEVASQPVAWEELNRYLEALRARAKVEVKLK